MDLSKRTPEERAAYWEGRYFELKASHDQLLKDIEALNAGLLSSMSGGCRHEWGPETAAGRTCTKCGDRLSQYS